MFYKIKEFIKYSKKINPSILSSSISFYILLMIYPLYNTILYVLNILNIKGFENIVIGFNEGFLSVIGFILSLIWVSFKTTNTLKVSSNIIFEENQKFSIIKIIKNYLFCVLLIFLIIIMIISSLFVVYFLESIIMLDTYFLIFIIELLLESLFITLLSSIIYKYIIPVKVKFKKLILFCFCITIIWYIVLLVFKLFLKYFSIGSYYILYGNITNLIIFMIIINLNVSVYLYGLMFNYFIKNIMNKTDYNGYNNIGQSEVIK